MQESNSATAPTETTQAAPRRPFKKLYCDWRKRIFVELKGAQLAVWLYHYLRSNKEDQSWPSVARVARETGLHRDTVIEARKRLFATGWLVKIETVFSAKFKTRLVAAVFPDEPAGQSEIPTSGSRKNRQSEIPVAGNSDQGGSEIPDTGKFRHKVDTAFEVDSISEGDTRTKVDTAAVSSPDRGLPTAAGGDDEPAATAANFKTAKPSSRNRKNEKLNANLKGKIAEEDT